MIKKRIIACLDIKDGRTVKGTNFVDLKDAGDPVELAAKYAEQGVDELVFLDISASQEKRNTLLDLVSKIAETIDIPFAVGGGINSVKDAKNVLEAGADKISINSAALSSPVLISQLSEQIGSQSIILAVDIKKIDEKYVVFSHGGSQKTKRELIEWICEAEKLGAGEILLTSMDHDGTRNGFAIDVVKIATSKISIPLIASGGAGKEEHFIELFGNTNASAALAAGIFHFGQIRLADLKTHLKNNNIAIR